MSLYITPIIVLFYSDLLSSDYVEIHYEKDKQVFSKGGEHCYYHGQVRGKETSQVALSTCNGLQGHDKTNNLLIYHILILDVSNILQYLFYFQFKRHKSKKHTRNFAKSVVNLVDAIFKEQLNTRVVLVAVEIWTDRDRIPLNVKPLDMLRDFSKYRQQNIRVSADAVHLFTNITFHYGRSNVAYIGGVCSIPRGVGVNEFGSTWTMAASLSQSLAQNLGIHWDPVSRRSMSETVTMLQHPRRFSRCSIADYKNFLLRGGASCLFNRPNKLFEATECGNGYVEVGEECDCGARMECYKDCCKKCSLSNGAHCSDGPCCNTRGYSCRYAVNDCDISETCSGDSGQCPPNLHKQDSYPCQLNQGRCYGGECKTRDSQCKYIWGPKAGGSEKHCYEKLNTEGSEKGNCGKDGEKWLPCSKHDVFCGYLLCTNIGRNPRIGTLKGDITPTTFNHQGRLVDCSGGRVLLDDDTDLGYVEDGTPCGPSMMCLERKCLPISSLNLTACPLGPNGRGYDIILHFILRHVSLPSCPSAGPSATNLIIGSIAGAILMAAIVLGGTGWGFK
uniref:ADAM metallopeptidase domain 23a n=1 Tax=Electrophorus electricus TaxID=8005 RepID=A0A4W4H078_ELEEL